ncbi:MAG TPA: SAM-dependent methyltransferase [Nitrospiria bacterium]|nr:SAM-dependent methyltransferase [Nitrospiria bacterium]
MNPNGNPHLIKKIRDEIEKNGPVTFARFMESALYDPEFGYYTAHADRIGLGGDFYTSPDVSPLFGRLLAKQLLQMSGAFPNGEIFTILELGAGKGLLCRDILEGLKKTGPDSLGRFRYLVLERSPVMIENQKKVLAASGLEEKVRWISDIREAAPLRGCIFSNELFDALPVHRVIQCDQGLRELRVDWKEGRFIEAEGGLSHPSLEAYFKDLDISLPADFRADLSLEGPDFIKEAGDVLESGYVLTVDYGHPAAELFSGSRRKGTLLCYYRHTANDDPYSRVGEQDITAHVDFTALARAGRESGLEVTGFTNQLNFLMGLGIAEEMEGIDPEAPEVQSVKRLLARESMGGVFKVLIQHKGIKFKGLSGLAFRPFFREALGV